MKPILIAASGLVMLCIGASVLVLGADSFLKISKEIEEYPTTPRDIAGSSGPPYPSFDGTWQYFGISIAFFAAGGLFLAFWRKRK